MAQELLKVGTPHAHPAIAGAPDSHDRGSRESYSRQPCTRGVSITLLHPKLQHVLLVKEVNRCHLRWTHP